MYSDDLKDRYKHFDSASLYGYGLLEKANSSGYVCPFCGNGTGKDGTGVEMQQINDGYKGYCHKCGRYFDVFDLLARRFNLDVTHQFKEVMDHAREIFGDAPRVKITPPPPPPPQQNFESFIKSSHLHLDNFLRENKAWRGLSPETLKKFFCGYVKSYPADRTERVIIPYSFGHYLARFPRENPPSNIKTKRHSATTKEIFGLKFALDALTSKTDLPIFAVEGEIDAMSIDQCGFRAVAFGGSSISVQQVDLLKKFPRGTNFILMLDNDKTGRNKAPDVKKTLQQCGFRVVIKFLDENVGDFNAFLQADPDGLKTALQENFDSSVEEFAKMPLVEAEPVKKDADEGPFTDDEIANCPLRLAVPTGFTFRAKGIYHVSKDKKTGEKVETIVTYTPILPVKIYTNFDGAGEKVALAFYDKFKHKWKTFDTEQVTIASAKEIIKLASYGVSVNSETAKKLSLFLTNIQRVGTNPLVIPRVTVHEKPGWTDNDCKTFLYPPKGEGWVIKSGGVDYAASFCTAGDKQKWLEIFDEAFENSIGVRYVVGMACAAPLVRLCKTRNFQCCLVAPSGSGKSAIAQLAMSIFGNPEKLFYPLNLTGNFADAISAKYNDLPIWLDDFQTTDRRTRENFSQLIFNHADGKTRGRMNRNSEIKEQFEFKGTRILTAEESVLREEFTQGTFSRMVELNASHMIPDALAVKIHQTLPSIYGHFGKDYCEYITHYSDAIPVTYDGLLTRIGDFGNFIPAHLQNISLAYTGLIYFCRFLEDRGDMKFSPLPRDESNVVHTPIVHLDHTDAPYFAQILPTPETSNNVVRAMNVISELRYTHEKSFDVEKKDFEGRVLLDRCGLPTSLGIKFLNGDIGFYPTELKKCLKELNMPSVTSLMNDCADKGLLKSDGDKFHKNMARCKPIDGRRPWLYIFPRQSFENF